MYIKEDILRLVKENDVRFIRLQFTDMNGCLKNIAITETELEKALGNRIVFDGSSIDGFSGAECPDMYLYPDLNSFTIFPWRPQQGKVARLICDVYKADGTPFEGDPRYVLKKELNRAEKMGYTFNVGPECEFFLFHTDDMGRPTTKTYDEGGYLDLAPLDMGEDCRRDLIQTLSEMGFDIVSSHHEVARGQHEIDFKYTDALTAADNIMTFKLVVKNIAYKHGLHATFMAKPVYGISGSGMHTNVSLFKKDENSFFDENGKNALSGEAYSFIAGLIKHAKALTAVLNPTVNSYKRLVSGFDAPSDIAWSTNDRSSVLRVPPQRGTSTRVELLSPDPTCNPYLAIASILRAGLDGIEKNLTVPSEGEKSGKLPGALCESIDALRNDDVVKEALGKYVFEQFSDYKTKEWNRYASQVTQWETDEYLTKF
jgi:glutamine synthetase